MTLKHSAVSFAAGAFAGIVLAVCAGMVLSKVDWSCLSWPRQDAAQPTPKPVDITQINLFQERKDQGTGFTFVTGTLYADAAAYNQGTVSSSWCYVNIARPSSAFDYKLTLANQTPPAAPKFLSPRDISSGDWQELGATSSNIIIAARQHCFPG